MILAAAAAMEQEEPAGQPQFGGNATNTTYEEEYEPAINGPIVTGEFGSSYPIQAGGGGGGYSNMSSYDRGGELQPPTSAPMPGPLYSSGQPSVSTAEEVEAYHQRPQPIEVVKGSYSLHFRQRYSAVSIGSSTDKARLDKKRERNREAARKCRQRKLDKIQSLENKVAELQKDNGKLSTESNRLRMAVSSLQEQLDFHLRKGCRVVSIPLDAEGYDEDVKYPVPQTMVSIMTNSLHQISPSEQQSNPPDSTCLS